MRPVMSLPADYELCDTFDLSSSKAIRVGLNLAGMVLFFGSAWLFLWISSFLVPAALDKLEVVLTLPMILVAFMLLCLLIVGVIILHELVHGIFFWLFTRHRPVFGFKGWYAYAAAPGWYIGRNQFMIVGVAPLFVLSLLGIALLPFVPFLVVPMLLVAMTMNVAGAVGDIFVVCWLLTKPSSCLIRDVGEAMKVYARKA